MTVTWILAALIVLLLAAFLSCIFIIFKMKKFNRDLGEHFTRSLDGRPDLVTSFSSGAKDGVSSGLNTFLGMTGEMMTQAFSMGLRLTEVSDSVKDDSNKLHEMSGKSSTLAAEVATAMHEMSVTINDIAANVSDTSNSSKNLQEDASKAEQDIEVSRTSLESLSGDISEWASINKALSESTDKITGIVTVINDIADQTNLLALNAAIEAARAGEQGRGFAVVAEEVRKLADKTSASTGEIVDMVQDIRGKADSSIGTMNETLGSVKLSIDRASKAEESLKSITSTAAALADMTNSIASSIEEQSSVSEMVSANMDEATKFANETTNLADNMLESGNDIAKHSLGLFGTLCTFRKDSLDVDTESFLLEIASELKLMFDADIKSGILSSADLLDDKYSPAGEDKFRTAASGYFNDKVLSLLKKWVNKSSDYIYVVVMDRNGFMPTHLIPARSGVRMLDEITQRGAKTQKLLGQAFRRPVAAGGELVVDISTPLVIGGKHWGCIRIGYLPNTGNA
jgi:methyl-accepting chemotaxis protein